MNRIALTEQRRETVIGLLKNMNIKNSADGGFDKDDVYECMQQLCDLYEKNIEELESAYEAELGQLKDRYQKYDENNELYVSLIMEAKKSSNEIITQAKTEVESILLEGKEQVAKQEAELSQMRIELDAEKQALAAEMNAAREALEAEKAAMKVELEAEREKALAAKNKYTQQITSMEEEFEEIKTNILRTAGKMDSLKSKLPNDEEVEWQMINDLGSVEFPVEDIAIENIIDAPVFEEAAAEPVLAEEPVAEVIAEEPAALTLEDLTGPDSIFPEAAVEEISFDDIEIELPELTGEMPAVEPAAEPVAEISFEGLEELFKENE